MVTVFNYDLDQSPGSIPPPLSPQLVTCRGGIIPLTTPDFCKSVQGSVFQQKRKSRPFVSIVSALVCKNAIIVASDSRMTDTPSYRDDAKKIFRIELKEGTALVAHSGHIDSSSAVLDFLFESVRGQALQDHRMIAEAASSAILRFKQNLAKQNGCTPKTVKAIIARDDLNCSLMVCHFFDGKPFIFAGNLNGLGGGLSRIRGFSHWSIGIGKELAQYFLSQFNIAEMDRLLAVSTAVSVIHEVKSCVTGCGGDIQVSAINSLNRSVELSAGGIRKIEARMADEIKDYKRQWLIKMERILTRGAQEYPSENITGLESYR
jgi:20S proteasome alpha/beta subunit